jgi:hypothetical protein
MENLELFVTFYKSLLLLSFFTYKTIPYILKRHSHDKSLSTRPQIWTDDLFKNLLIIPQKVGNFEEIPFTLGI